MAKKVTLYYADWCGHCQKFKPEWQQVKEQLDKRGISHAEFEADRNSKEVQKAGIRGFPTIMIEKDGVKFEHKGPRSADAIINSVEIQNGGYVQGGGGKRSKCGCGGDDWEGCMQCHLRYEYDYKAYKYMMKLKMNH